jgi:hypothetical protein
MFDDRYGGTVQTADRSPGRIGVEQVVERQLLPAQLLRVEHADRRLTYGLSAVGGAALLRVLAVAHGLGEPTREAHLLRPFVVLLFADAQKGGDQGVVSGNMGECFRGQRATTIVGDLPAFELCEHRGVIAWVRQDDQVREVLGGCPEHRRTANVDLLDRVRL